MLIEQQIAERRERAQATVLQILERPKSQLYGDYRVESASGKAYRVAMRGPGLFENYCSCPDFAVNTLGTCKHIEALLLQLRQRHGKALERKKYARSRASISLEYGVTIEVRLRLPLSPSPALKGLAEEYFDAAGRLRREHFQQFAKVLDALRRADDQAVIYSDVLEYVERENEIAEGLQLERKLLAKFTRGRDPLAGVLKTKLLPYQVRGAIFAACRGRVVLADDMGLGKTVQALAATELLRQRRGIERVLVVAPASVKYQWKTEIEKFSNLSAQVIDGLLPRRQGLYAAPAFFNLTSYELVLKDVRYMHELRPDLIILDEAQRIRNWATATARTIKQLKSRYAFVLTGTPLENKLEELFSVVEFVDGRRLGPAFRFLHEHRMEDEEGHLLGYRGLDRIHDQLAPVLLRRTRKEVLKDLPERTDQIFHVALTKEQAEPYWEQSDILAALMRKWEKQKWLSEIDMRRILCCLQNMRMLCNSTFLFDKETNHSPKLAEFREIVRELTLEENRKVVVFSEYERMTHLAGQELDKLRIGFVSLHGGVPSRQRGALMEKFRSDPECKVFLSTDAGGVGLNLQAASAVINFEPPWNPARLEQRIGRVHRMGQSRPVQVVHLLTTGTIEERVWETLRLKKSLFEGVFDSPVAEVDFAALKRKSVLQTVKEIFAGQPGRPKPVIDPTPPGGTGFSLSSAPPGGTGFSLSSAPVEAVPVKAAVQVKAVGEDATASAGAAVSPLTPLEPTEPPHAAIGNAASSLIEAGVKFLESLAWSTAVPSSGEAPGNRIQQTLSGLISQDPRTHRPVLSIPLPESLTEGRLANALAGLLNALVRPG
ncbi:MAG: DEAD/DEAH box helicase [Acidobacteriia bacterium]|nr:DEAD/DEAH box helicase [Terriglobia bacterium]